MGQTDTGCQNEDQGEAFRRDPAIVATPGSPHRYNAACFAALASSGHGIDAPPDGDERAKLRLQALRWLEDERAKLTRLLENGTAEDRAMIAGALQHFKPDPDLTGVRDPEALTLSELSKQPEEVHPATAMVYQPNLGQKISLNSDEMS